MVPGCDGNGVTVMLRSLCGLIPQAFSANAARVPLEAPAVIVNEVVVFDEDPQPAGGAQM